ncbi:MAG: TOBE domain-containing protein [Bacilli bacterium]|nr:TOBE domain-containing protein [Bacilli bacterium]
MNATYTPKGIRLSNDVIVPLNKKLDVKEFLKNEINRLIDIKKDLENALLNQTDYNHVVYEQASSKADELINKFNDKLKSDFPIRFGVRPEHIIICDDDEKEFDAKIKAEIVELLGSELYVHSHIGDSEIVIKSTSGRDINSGDELKIKFDINKTHYFDNDTEESVAKFLH